MKVQTFLFGEVEVNPENVIAFPQGLLGFENSRNFMLAHDADQSDPASYTLQSLDDPHVALQIVDSTTMGFHYELALSEAETTLLQNPAPEDFAVMLVLFKPEAETAPSVVANIRAPLLINIRARVGMQKEIEKLRSNITLSNLSRSV